MKTENEKKLKYPWYVWLSLLGFILMYGKGGYFIFCRKRSASKIDLWVPFLVKMLALTFGLLAIPVGLMNIPVNYAYERNYVVGAVLNCVQLVYFYAAGVIAARSLHRHIETKIKTAE